MKKLFLIIALLVCLVGVAQAEVLPGLISGSSGYLSSSQSVAVFFNGYAGESIAVAGFSDYVQGFCGVSSLTGGSNSIDMAYMPSDMLTFVVPYNDVYLAVCIKAGGLSDDILMAVVDNSIYGFRSSLKSAEQDYTQELVDKLKSETEKLLPR